MRTAIRWSLPFVLCILAAGCSGGKRFDYNGEWMGNRNLDRPDLDQVMRYTLGRVTLTIKDARYDRTEAGAAYSGNVSYSGDHIELETDTFMDRPINERGADAARMHPTIKVTPQEDGSLLFDDPKALDGKPVKLTRKAK